MPDHSEKADKTETDGSPEPPVIRTEAAPSGAKNEVAGLAGEKGKPPLEDETAEKDAPDEEESLPVPAVRRRGRFQGAAPNLPWWRLVLPVAGVILWVGCLSGLIGGGQLPGWVPWWNRPGANASGLVIIDPGHGGGDSGAVAQGVVEKDLNLDVGLRVGRALRARGVAVRLTREDDHFVPLEDRVRFANALPGAVFVSIHFNDASGDGRSTGSASGIETYYCEHKLAPTGGWMWASLLGKTKAPVPDAGWAIHEGQTLAGCIQGTLIAGTQAENRGIKERSLYVTHRVSGPAVLVEGGFVSHPGEARRLGDPTYRQVLAECIAEGIVRYLHAAQPAPLVVAAGA